MGPGLGPSMGSENHILAQSQSQHQVASQSQIKRAKQTKAQTQALSHAVVSNMTANSNNFNGGQNQSNNYPAHNTSSGMS
jgi:ABC-type uncharacterized transport system ATPase component